MYLVSFEIKEKMKKSEHIDIVKQMLATTKTIAFYMQ